MKILMIDSQRVNYIEQGEYASGLGYESYSVEVTSLPSDEQLAIADGIIAFHSVVINAPLVAKMLSCRALVKATIGLDDVDIDALTAKGIVCANIGSVGAEEVAEHAIALILLAQRKLCDYARHTRQGGWNWRSHAGEVKSCADTSLGLIGYGATGQALARKAAALGFRICFYDPGIERCPEGIAHSVTFDALLGKSDVLSLHLPLIPETEHLMDDERFSRLKHGTTLINTARGGIVDTDALLRALQAGIVSMALLDVVQEEPILPAALISHERVILTPHAAFYSERSLAQLKANALETLLRMLRGERVETVVNPNLLIARGEGICLK